MTAAGRIVVVGTAGHVDHGKSTLVEALTGTHPDRLAEEQARQLTIDLGFAHAQLPSGDTVSFVDVPGHGDFLRNMLAGVGAIHAAVLVVAADEGPMPQTAEHLAILDLLGVHRAIVALTKIDAVSDSDWLDLVEVAVLEALEPTGLAGSPVVRVSAPSRDGLPALTQALAQMITELPEPRDIGQPRLAVDRSFAIPGHGTVVTGTLQDGALTMGQDVTLLPSGDTHRIRGLQVHGQQVSTAQPGTRVAVNLAGVEADAIGRGDWLATARHPVSDRLDAWLRVLASAPVSVAHDDEVHVHHGSGAVVGRIRVLGQDTVEPGSEGPIQLVVRQPVAAVAGDRLVVRRLSPGATLGGGVVLDPAPTRLWPRHKSEGAERLRGLRFGTEPDRVWHGLRPREPAAVDDMGPLTIGLSREALVAALSQLNQEGRARQLGSHWITDAGWDRWQHRAETVLARYHRSHPLRSGPPREELRRRMGLTAETFSEWVAAAVEEGWLREADGRLALDSHTVNLNTDQQAALDRLESRLRAAPFAPPSLAEIETDVGADIVAAALDQGRAVVIAPDIAIHRDAYDAAVSEVTKAVAEGGQVAVADLRDRLGTSRKYVLALLEHLDRERVTRREGDVRVAGVALKRRSV